MGIQEQREHAVAGRWYDDLTAERVAARQEAVRRTDAYNATFGRPPEERERVLATLLRSVGAGAHFEPTFRCEFGFNIEIGRNFYANFDCVILDGGTVVIGDDVLLGPRVAIYTTNHALDAADRAGGACLAQGVDIGDRVWIGGGVTVNPGVRIGAGSVIGSGSVVTRSVPADTLAAGVPARPLRAITEADRVRGPWRGL